MNPTKISRHDLAGLGKEDLLELLSITEQLGKNAQKIGTYIPNVIQNAVHRSPKFIRALFSGNGVGKTTACIQEAIWTATGTHPHKETSRIPNTTIIVLDDSSKSDTVYWAEMKKKRWYDPDKIHKEKHGRAYTTEWIFPNGSNVLFMTHEMAEDKWESIQAAGIIFDEPPPRFIFAALLRGMREQDMKPWMMFAGTPRGKNAPWMYREIYRPWKFNTDDEIECFFGSTDDNLHNLDPDTIKRWEKRYSKAELDTRRHGSFEFLSGRIFDTFNRDLHVVDDFPFPKQWVCILAIDPHLRKNHTAVILGVDPDGDVYVLRELETSLAGRAAAQFFILACEPYNVRFGVCDNFGSIKLYDDGGAEERKSFIDIFNEQALKMNRVRVSIRPTTRKEKRDDEWIEDMRDWLRLETDHEGNTRPRFKVFASCVKTIDNFETYIWDEYTGKQASAMINDPKEAPLGTNQDFLMCVKYGMALKPDKIGRDRVYQRGEMTGRTRTGGIESDGFRGKEPKSFKEWRRF
jgi:hypothetical protein